ncbi:hypothetical protein [Flavimaricola marinus]|uniref:Uncharacterized protein n=1 Tax=Flavimaricola marinus TaxID=1819565 RepID=A0A238L8P3_9RHOB|nr:hypothetical protein [Flavimaricola marinus]SMY06038.1 hypothetical protein LOM8899_00159 [Flavimaricola marinus]
MSIKMIALAAATVAATASIAQADVNYFAFGETLEASSNLDLGTIRAAGEGVVEVYDFRGGEQGALLGSTVVHAGANQDVRVNVGNTPLAEVLAVITVDGQTVAAKDYQVSKR